MTYPAPAMKAELDNWEFLHVNVDEHPDMQAYFGVSGIPVTVVVDGDGKEAQRWKGFEPPDSLAAALKALRTP
ncbi:MAG: thioredoxin family protein [Planctomycetota bacterium]|nr:thioredoxin family protein [Planctomycetota bacterium]